MWITSNLNPKYEVNESGQVRHKIKGNILKGYITKDGYRKFCMYDENTKRKDYSCHRLVAEAFLENPNGYTEINHKDFNKLNNSIENLEWCSHKENMEHWRKAQNFYTENEPDLIINENRYQRSVPVGQYSLQGKLLNVYSSYTEAEQKTGIRNSNISLAARGKRHTAGGYVWRDIMEGSTTIRKE